MKKIICIVFVVCLCLVIGISAFADGKYYLSTIEVDYGTRDSDRYLYSMYGVTRESLTAKKLYGIGIKHYNLNYDEGGEVAQFLLIHNEPVDGNLIKETIMKDSFFEIRDSMGNVVMDRSHLLDAREYECDNTIIIDEYGGFDVSMAFTDDGNGNAVPVYVPVTDAKRYLMGFVLNDEGKNVFADMTEKLASMGEGKNYFEVYINGRLLKRYLSKGRFDTGTLWYITENADEIKEIENAGYSKPEMFLPDSVKVVSTNKPLNIECSEWAIEDVFFIHSFGLLNLDEKEDYTKPISREDFCIYAAGVIDGYVDRVTGEYREMESYREPFTDTNSKEVAMLYELGIINGTSEKTFSPNATITREESAAIMCRMLKLLSKGDYVKNTDHTFDDNSEISDWAREEVYIAYANEIMNGVGNNQFNPSGIYTAEQCFATLKRTILNISKKMFDN